MDLGAERVVVLPRDELWLVERVAAAVRAPVRPGWVTVVGGSCGGAGASTLSTALALAAVPAGDVLLVDGDGWGGGLDLVLGAEQEQGLRWPELSGRIAGPALVAALPTACSVPVLAASRDAPEDVPGEALASVVRVVRAARDAGHGVVVDLPGHGRPAGPVLAEADLAVLLVPGRLRAAAAARALLGAAAGWSGARVVVRSVPGGLSRQEVAGVLGRPVLAELGHDRSAVARGERGEPPSVAARSPLGVLCRQLLAELAQAGAA